MQLGAGVCRSRLIFGTQCVCGYCEFERTVISGGFSMGGALALQFGYRFCTDLAGVFALSSFLNENSSVYEVDDSF